MPFDDPIEAVNALGVNGVQGSGHGDVLVAVVSGLGSPADVSSYAVAGVACETPPGQLFATVAEATIAIASVLGLLIDRIIRRGTFSTVTIFAFIALLVVPWQLNAISFAGGSLLVSLSL
ncbi:hypothetical protein [Microbacterium sp. CPCC 204701]|uniref:hypothetical protein n=1 Tax=Microbacterium sp. CPCC 204701 TaxID=2493084 RepID=UPI000FD91371|nr:hypothetical protein [Microbacterium sp. CPCC 204701]